MTNADVVLGMRKASPCELDCFFTSLSVMAGPRRMVEKLWREFFSDPSQWWDHRAEKVK
jgi:hypothetical protein